MNASLYIKLVKNDYICGKLKFSTNFPIPILKKSKKNLANQNLNFDHDQMQDKMMENYCERNFIKTLYGIKIFSLYLLKNLTKSDQSNLNKQNQRIDIFINKIIKNIICYNFN